MQLNITTDYAIRIVLYLASNNGTVSSRVLSEKMVIPQNYVLKITKKLTNAGLIETRTGVQGGFVLKKDAEIISLFTIIEIMENTTKLNRCLEEDKYCSRHGAETCPVRSYYCSVQNVLEEKLSAITIKEILKKGEREDVKVL